MVATRYFQAQTRGVALVAKPGGARTGVGRYVAMLEQNLRDADLGVQRIAPSVPPLPAACYRGSQRLGLDIRTFLLNFPIWASYPRADLYHLTSQNLASLLLLRRPPGATVVTVHDIIPYMLRHDRQLCSYRTAADRLFDRIAMAGLRRADLLIADSHYSKACVVEQLGIAPERIEVVYLGIDQARFRPLAVADAVRERYGLPADRRYLIYVGSEDPRKNLGTLIAALAQVRQQHPDIALIKVGRAHFDAERQRLRAQATDLGLGTAIHFLDDVPEADLPSLYNLAAVCVMPSLYEGFGFPVLEALACGTPVVCSTAPSLVELVGDTARQHQPRDPQQLATQIQAALATGPEQTALRERGRVRAADFTWQRTIAQTCQVYERTLAAGQRKAVV